MNVAARYERAACGLLTTGAKGAVVAVNQTLLDWLGRSRDELLGMRFTDLLTAGGRIYHETHYAPMLAMQGKAREIAFELVRGDGNRLPVLVNARVDSIGGESVIHVAIFDASDRRSYERELLAAKQRAEASEEKTQILTRTLQDTLLPHRVPAVSGLDIAASFVPAGEGLEIGGDFYDVFQVTGDEWILTIGDVEGKGVEAALITSIVRHSIRAAAIEHEPAGVLKIVNEVLLRDESERFCTALVLRCRQRDGRWWITIASGGHPLPILAGPHGVQEVGQFGTLLGGFDEPVFHDVDVSLDPSHVLVLYTDGISEARQGERQLGEAGLIHLLAGLADRPAAEVLSQVIETALDFGGKPNRDDMAAIAIRLSDTHPSDERNR